jgi:DNA-directed RNA polymerase specialized sigma24 family protein
MTVLAFGSRVADPVAVARRARRGDRRAVRLLLRQHSGRLHDLLVAITADDSRADELLTPTLLAALAHERVDDEALVRAAASRCEDDEQVGRLVVALTDADGYTEAAVADLLCLPVDRVARLRAQTRAALGLRPPSHRYCRGRWLVVRRHALASAEQAATYAHLELCFSCRDEVERREQTRSRLAMRASALVAAAGVDVAAAASVAGGAASAAGAMAAIGGKAAVLLGGAALTVTTVAGAVAVTHPAAHHHRTASPAANATDDPAAGRVARTRTTSDRDTTPTSAPAAGTLLPSEAATRVSVPAAAPSPTAPGRLPALPELLPPSPLRSPLSPLMQIVSPLPLSPVPLSPLPLPTLPLPTLPLSNAVLTPLPAPASPATSLLPASVTLAGH